MPLVHFLYRCPRCGHDPLEGEGDQARCSACGTRFARGRGGGLLTVVEADGGSWEVPVAALGAALDALGGPIPRARGPQGRLEYASTVEVRRAFREEALRFRGELLGFAETLGRASRGVLRISGDDLSLWPEPPPGTPESRSGEGSEPLDRWPLMELGGVQTSSISLQIAPRGGGLVQFRFPGDSPRRWEDLLHRALREAYLRAGLGEIVEFQPRIRTA